jgi:hypothetical protein
MGLSKYDHYAHTHFISLLLLAAFHKQHLKKKKNNSYTLTQ